jgi:hypothetical protein
VVNFELMESRPQAQPNAPLFHKWEGEDAAFWTRFYRMANGYLLRFSELADFELSADARNVRCWAVPGITMDTVQHLYLNQVLPLALSLLGKFVLHASAVEIGDGAVAFVGESGRGKSTLAASFATNGYRFLTDDGLVLERDGGECRVMPSHPSIRLWEDSEEALICPDAPVAPAVQFTSKSRFFAGKDIAFCEQPRRLRRVFFLGDGEQTRPVFERMSSGVALIELVKHSFLLDIEEQQMLASHFDELTDLLKRSIIYRLDYPRNYDDLARVREAIVDHVQAEGDAT